MMELLAYLTQCLARRNSLYCLSLPRTKAFLGLCDPRFIYGCKRFVLHLYKQSLSQSFTLRRRQLLRLFLESRRSCSHRLPLGRRTYGLGQELYKV